MKKKRITIDLDFEVYNELSEISEKEERTISYLSRKAIENHIKIKKKIMEEN